MARYSALLTTAQVAEVLELPEWRVIKFAQGKEYGIKPAFSTGKGSGSRRLYSLENVFQFGLALRLLETGLRSKVIGRVIRMLREQEMLKDKLTVSEQEAGNLYLAIMREPRTGQPLDQERFQLAYFVEGIVGAEDFLNEVQEEFGKRPNCDVILILIGPLFLKIKQRLAQIESRQEGED